MSVPGLAQRVREGHSTVDDLERVDQAVGTCRRWCSQLWGLQKREDRTSDHAAAAHTIVFECKLFEAESMCWTLPGWMWSGKSVCGYGLTIGMNPKRMIRERIVGSLYRHLRRSSIADLARQERPISSAESDFHSCRRRRSWGFLERQTGALSLWLTVC
jgi:hypothetical protein